MTITLIASAAPTSFLSAPAGSVSGGTIAIDKMFESALRVAPDSIGMQIDYSMSNFDLTAGPIYTRWQFGIPGQTWDKPRLFSEWRDANKAIGGFVATCYKASGSYLIQACAWQPATNKFSSTSSVHNVSDPDTAYDAANTHIVAHDGDFTDAPVGTQHASIDDLRAAVTAETDANIRVRIKLGADYDMPTGNLLFPRNKHVMVDTWGDGTRPMMKPSYGTLADYVNVISFSGASQSSRYDVRITGLACSSDWDPTDATGRRGVSFVVLHPNAHAVIDDVAANNLNKLVFNQGTQSDLTAPFFMHVNDFSCTAFRNYPIYTGPLTGSAICLSGGKHKADPNAQAWWASDAGSTPDSGDAGAPVRINCSHTYIAGMEFLSVSGHEVDGMTQNYAQPCIRGYDTPVAYTGAPTDEANIVNDHWFNINRCHLESPNDHITLHGNFFGASVSPWARANSQVACNVFIGGKSARTQLRSYVGAAPDNFMMFESNLFSSQDIPYHGNAFYEFMGIGVDDDGTGDPVEDIAAAQGTIVVNGNTGHFGRAREDNNFRDVILFQNGVNSETEQLSNIRGDVMTIEDRNNVFMRPEDQDDAPLETETLLAIQPVYPGYISEQGVLNASFAHLPMPTFQVKDGSSAIGSATGDRPDVDLLMQDARTKANRGCW